MVINFPKHRLTHRFTNSERDGWLCCVPFYARMYRLAHQAKHLKLLEHKPDER